MFKSNRYTATTVRTAALAAIFGAGAVLAGAQSSSNTQPAAHPTLDLHVPAVDTSSASLFSTSADQEAPVAEASLHPTVENFAESMQYGGGQRRRYGKTRYRGANTNADGSSKYIFYGGAGLAQPIGNTYHYLTPSYGIQVGGARQLNKHFAVPIEFDYDHFGFAGETLQNQSALYFGDANPSDNGLDGSSHVWSFSVDPTYTIVDGSDHGGLGAYVVAGVGFYHKVANFTVPQEEEYCDPIYGFCEPVEVTGTFDHYTSNAPGFSGGFGVTYKFSRFANERFYAEVRYVFVDDSQRYGYTANDIVEPDAARVSPRYSASSPDPNNLYPANSNRTSYIPIKVGIRF